MDPQQPAHLLTGHHPPVLHLDQQSQRVRVGARMLAAHRSHQFRQWQGFGHWPGLRDALNASSRILWTPIASPQWVRPPLAMPCIASQSR